MVYVGNKWMLGGLTSFGKGCNDGGVYARTSNYYNWILQNLQQKQKGNIHYLPFNVKTASAGLKS